MEISRRMLLRGLGGFSLALPFLPSLDSREAKAGPVAGPRRYIALRTGHGGVLGSNRYPAEATLTESMPYAGYNVRRGDLKLTVQDSKASLSPVLTASSARFTQALANKMNLLGGLDIPFFIGHHQGGSLGNYSDSQQVMESGLAVKPQPTCDQVLAWSPKFYDDLSSNMTRSMVVGDDRLSWGWSNPMDPANSTVEKIQSTESSLKLFEKIYKAPVDPGAKRPAIADLVLEDYKRLRNGNRRLSSDDRNRLDAHISRVHELQRKLAVTATCGERQPPVDSEPALYADQFFLQTEKHKEYWQLMNEVIVAGLVCDTSRIVAMQVDGGWFGGWFTDFAGDFHLELVHTCHLPESQKKVVANKQAFFEFVFLDLMEKLDAVPEANGATLLDSCLMFWAEESGPYTHDAISLPVLTAGGANGWLKTGSYIDYSNRNLIGHKASDGPAGEVTHIGLLYNQFLGTTMQAMGLSPADYEDTPGTGYGQSYYEKADWYPAFGKYTDKVRKAAGEVLPFLKA